ncbi:MAG: C40 family peptidase [Ignavibacteriaceae bacterium]
MRLTNYLIFILFLSAGVVIYSGCSASSNSVRYNEKPDKNEEKSPAVRFTSEDNNDKNDNNNSNDNLDGEELPVEKSIDISPLINKNDSFKNSEFSTVKEKMLMEIIKYLNTPYKFGGNSKDGIDCSAFTQKVYSDCVSISLLRTAQDQYNEGAPVDDVSNLKFGDLIFFDTRRNVKPGHVGIYLGDNLFAHASSKQGVTVSTLTSEYYYKRFMGGRRIEELYGSGSLSK